MNSASAPGDGWEFRMTIELVECLSHSWTTRSSTPSMTAWLAKLPQVVPPDLA